MRQEECFRKNKNSNSLLPMSSNFDGFTRKVCQSKDRGDQKLMLLHYYSITVLQCYSVTAVTVLHHGM